MKDRSKLLAIVLVIVTIIILVFASIFNKKEDAGEKDIHVVKNYSNFYTVSSCLYRTITYINSNDTESLLLILTDKYKRDNNINENNVLEVFPYIEDNSTFNPKKMYYEKLTDNITKYYVFGYVEREELIENIQITKPDRLDVYFIVYLDTSKKIFSVEPYSGNIFLDGDIDE